MAGVRFADVRSRPTEFLDFTSLTLGVSGAGAALRGCVPGAYDGMAPRWETPDCPPVHRGRGSIEGYTPSRVDAARADDGTLIFSWVVWTWINAVARRRSCLRVSARIWPFWRWPGRRPSVS